MKASDKLVESYSQSGFKPRLMKTLGLGIVVGSLTVTAEAQFGAGMVNVAIQEICKEIMGDLGGLLTAVAGFGAIVAAAFGAYKAFYSAILTAVGAFTVSSILSLYFPDAAGTCNGAAPAAAARTSPAQAIDAGLVAQKSNDDFFNFDANSIDKPDAENNGAAVARKVAPEVHVKDTESTDDDPFNSGPLDPVGETF